MPGLRDLTGAGEGGVDHAHALHVAGVLAEVADGRALLDGHLAAIGLLLLHDETEDGRFTGAVGPDQTDLLPAEDRAGGVHEEDLPAVLLGDAIEADHLRRAL